MNILTSCSTDPEPIDYGHDVCTYCEMTIVEKQFGSELVTQKGKIKKFDSIECLAAFVLEDKTDNAESNTLWITDFYNYSSLIPAKESNFLVSPKLHSPMGLSISGYENIQSAQKAFDKYGGDLMEWNDVKEYVNEKWLGN